VYSDQIIDEFAMFRSTRTPKLLDSSLFELFLSIAELVFFLNAVTNKLPTLECVGVHKNYLIISPFEWFLSIAQHFSGCSDQEIA